jgi:riboflavin kinase/FMN adenylyltransferase
VVREFVLEGRVEGARLLTGRDHELEGVVVRGDGRGRAIGIPTANLAVETELLPHTGVYAGWAQRVDIDGPIRAAAINVGTLPTFGGERPVGVEAHLLDTDEDLYGVRLRLGLSERLRGEERFVGVDALVAQIHKDIDRARARFHASRNP